MSKALLLSVIHKLEKYRGYNYPSDEDETNGDGTEEVESKVEMERVIKEMREIVDIVKDKKLEEGRTLKFFVSDLDEVADDALDHCKKRKTNCWKYESIHSWIGEIKQQIRKLRDDESNMRSSEKVDDDKYVVGLNEDVEKLLRIIVNLRKSWTTLIKGMCGIGKTTLAREIFNHPTITKEFELRAWVSNSTYFTMKELLIKLIQQVVPQKLHTSSLLENMDNRSLRDMLCQHLRGKRYLLVLDDIPKQIRLFHFLEALRKGNKAKRGRLLLTSHITHTDIYEPDLALHKMKPLDYEKSWQLFLKTINHGNKLTGEHKFPMKLEHMGKQMLRKCGGLPLAIKEVGKQLVEKKLSGGSEWEQLLESVDFGPILKLFEPFYHQLDPELKLCFMSMSFFKENTTLRKERLIRIWIAVGEVEYEYQCRLYLRDLINESVIDVKEKSTEYSMNSMLHMLSIQKAEEKLGFEILRSNGNNRPSESPHHHRVIICSRDKFKYSTDQDKHLVSLFFHGGGYLDTSPSYWKSFELLKILDLEDFGLKILPENISTLMELIYLGLRNNYIKELPQSLECLKKLEVLDIAQNFMVEVPDGIWELDSLLHLYMSDVICRKPFKIDASQSLETLTYVSTDDCQLSGFGKFVCLKKLGIEGLDGNSDVSKLFVSLADLKNLEQLILRGYRFRSMPCLDEIGILRLHTLKLDGLITRLPNNLPGFIKSLTLVNSCLDEDPMPRLAAMLPELDYLKLRNAYTGQQMVILHDGFPRLKVLFIEALWNLRNVQCGKGAMHRLQRLEIHECPDLDNLPEEIVSVKSLKEIKMATTKNIAAKIKSSDITSEIRILNVNP